MSLSVKTVVCEYCKGYCRVLAKVENDRLVSCGEDPSYPLFRQIFPATRGCRRLRAAAEIMYHPDRVNFPLKRVGEKGEGKWRQISWEQPASPWERPFLAGNYGGEQALPASIPGEYDHKTDYEIFREPGLRVGQEKGWPWKNLEEVYDYWLEPVGMSFRKFTIRITVTVKAGAGR